jgi:hypothetical protein
VSGPGYEAHRSASKPGGRQQVGTSSDAAGNGARTRLLHEGARRGLRHYLPSAGRQRKDPVVFTRQDRDVQNVGLVHHATGRRRRVHRSWPHSEFTGAQSGRVVQTRTSNFPAYSPDGSEEIYYNRLVCHRSPDQSSAWVMNDVDGLGQASFHNRVRGPAAVGGEGETWLPFAGWPVGPSCTRVAHARRPHRRAGHPRSYPG